MGETEASFAFMITLANVFGIFPVSRKDVAGRKQLYFKWRSFKVIYCLTIVICPSFVSIVLDLRLMIHEGTKFMRLGNFTK